MQNKSVVIGCLSVNVSYNLPSIKCKVENPSPFTKVEIKDEGNPINISTESCNFINVLEECKNNIPKVGAYNKNIQIKLASALVCMTSIGTYELFYVTEGPLIVSNGYFMVERKRYGT